MNLPDQIVIFLYKNGKSTIEELLEEFQITSSNLYHILRKLVKQNSIVKTPNLYYEVY